MSTSSSDTNNKKKSNNLVSSYLEAIVENLHIEIKNLNKIQNIIMAGIGGTGVSTVAAIIVMAARIDKKWSQSMNFTGLAQKNGAVTSQIRISKN